MSRAVAMDHEKPEKRAIEHPADGQIEGDTVRRCELSTGRLRGFSAIDLKTKLIERVRATCTNRASRDDGLEGGPISIAFIPNPKSLLFRIIHVPGAKTSYWGSAAHDWSRQ